VSILQARPQPRPPDARATRQAINLLGFTSMRFLESGLADPAGDLEMPDSKAAAPLHNP
jgi:hypothetical protein